MDVEYEVTVFLKIYITAEGYFAVYDENDIFMRQGLTLSDAIKSIKSKYKELEDSCYETQGKRVRFLLEIME